MDALHLGAGLGLKPQHHGDALAARAPGLWFEVHAENHLVEGGPRLEWLLDVRRHHPVALHGVSLSLASADELDAAHLRALSRLVDRVGPALVSEHLAWNRFGGAHAPDLLPVPRTRDLLDHLVPRVQRVQDRLGRRLAIENPSHYLPLPHGIDEIDFLHELAARSGCALLVDVNNLFVAQRNVGQDALSWVDRVDPALVAEVHVAGHHADPELGEALLIDGHDRPVAPPVWGLARRLLARCGPRPVLLERDGEVPAFADLMAERGIAQGLVEASRPRRAPAVAPVGHDGLMTMVSA